MQNGIDERTDELNGKSPKETGLTAELWRFFSSMKTAIWLLIILAIASIAGTVVAQKLPTENYVEMYGERGAAIIDFLRLNDVYHSSWYSVLLALIGVNLAVCSINRFGIAWQKTFHPRVNMKSEQVAAMQRSEKLTVNSTVSETAEKITDALSASSYHLEKENDDDSVSIYASKGRWGIWGPYLTHLSILVIFAGAMIGNSLGFEGFINIPEGGYTDTYVVDMDTNPQENPLGFRVHLADFTVTRDENGNDTGYKSDLIIYEDGNQIKRKIIDVNHPLTYKGISFFQSTYGFAGFGVKITAPDGETADAVLSTDTHSGVSQIELDGKKLVLFMRDYASGSMDDASQMTANIVINDKFPDMNTWTDLGWLGVSQTTDYKGYKVTVEKTIDYTGLQVAKNPGLPIIYTGFGLILLGVFMSFYITHKSVRIRITPSKGKTSVVVGASARTDQSVFDKDFERLKSSLSQ